MSKRLYVLSLVMLMAACGENNSNKKTDVIDSKEDGVLVPNEIGHDGTAEFTAEQKKKLRFLSKKNLRDLRPEEKAMVVDVLWEQLSNSDLLTITKQICQTAALEGDKACSTVRDTCLKTLVGDKNEEAFKAQLKNDEGKIRTRFANAINKSDFPAQDLEIIFEMWDDTARVISTLSCATSMETIIEAGNKTKSDRAKKFGDAKLKQIEPVFQLYIAPYHG